MISGTDTETGRHPRRAGVYYTHDDVTAYIAERTLLPRVLDVAAARCPEAFAPRGSAWRLLAENAEGYIPGVLAHGVDRTMPRLRAGRLPPPELALPTETWPECLARRQRYRDLLRLLHKGDVCSINDLVTLNLDIRRWVLDLVGGGRADVRDSLADAADSITVLDPTCGDGAFLLAALRVLEDLAFPGEQPTIRRSCLVKHLYGVDLRREAVAGCKKNLLAALRELDTDAELPNLDQNIQCGNALTGNIKRGSLNWDAAFPAIIQGGGFDVIIGNPPYVAADRVGYRVAGFATARCPDVYAWVLERAARLLRPGGWCGMIVPLSLAFSEDFAACRQLLFAEYECNWFASFGRIPAALFASDIRVRNVIHLGKKGCAKPRAAFTTRLHRWFEDARPNLFALLEFAPFAQEDWRGRVPKLGRARLIEHFAELRRRPARLGDSLSPRPTPHVLHYKQTAYNWLTFCRRLPPCYDAVGEPCVQTQFDTLYFRTAWQRDAAMLLLNGKLMFAYWIAVGDDFHVARWMIADFPVDLEMIEVQTRKRLAGWARRLERAMERATGFKRNAGKRVGTYNLARCREITDRSDAYFARLLGLEDVWPDVELLCAHVVKTDFGAKD